MSSLKWDTENLRSGIDSVSNSLHGIRWSLCALGQAVVRIAIIPGNTLTDQVFIHHATEKNNTCHLPIH